VANILIENSGGRSYLAEPPRCGRRIVTAFWLLLGLALLPFALLFHSAVPSVRPVSTLMVVDKVLLRDVDRQWVNMEDIAPVLVNTVMMSEDGQFCSHDGVDWHQLSLVLEASG